MQRIIVVFLGIILSLSATAAEINIDMLNKEGRERNVYSKKIVYVAVGDTVHWKSKSKGHNVEFILKNGVPSGVTKFKSRLSKNAQYTFKIPGIYAYWCTPHKSMGMIAVVIVGDDLSNLDQVKSVRVFGKSKRKLEEILSLI